MLAHIPTFKVTLAPDSKMRQEFRVPKDKLKAFLDVLVFNGTNDFRVTREPDPPMAQQSFQQSHRPV